MKNHYEILEIVESAAPELIEAAWKIQMRQCHPDLNPGNEAAAKRALLVNQAHDVLGNPLKRAEYDAQLQLNRKPKHKQEEPEVFGQRWDVNQGYYPPAYATNAEDYDNPAVDKFDGQMFATQVGNAFLDHICNVSPSFRMVMDTLNATKGVRR